MPNPIGPTGQIRWVVTGKSPVGQQRADWWRGRVRDLTASGSIGPNARMADAARAIHPIGVKPCQICGRDNSVNYVYPTKMALRQLNVEIGAVDIGLLPYDSIDEVIEKLVTSRERQAFAILSKVFKVPSGVPKNAKRYGTFIRGERRTKLSPGMMSNPPDRFDGFHDYGICCRALEDTGRHQSNLQRYGEDRRAYEHWADGDWKAASWLMKRFAEGGVSADHIGPISLGFTHRPTFQPMLAAANAAKNNRMTLADVRRLLADEHAGEQVVSWHTAAIWNGLKNLVRTDRDALDMSKLMRRHMHHVLSLLAALKSRGHTAFLISLLHPGYAFYSIEFVAFDFLTGHYDKMVKVPGNRQQYTRNAQRYERIALEALDLYAAKENRQQHSVNEAWLNRSVLRFEGALGNGTARAKGALIDAFAEMAAEAHARFKAREIPDEDLD